MLNLSKLSFFIICLSHINKSIFYVVISYAQNLFCLYTTNVKTFAPPNMPNF